VRPRSLAFLLAIAVSVGLPIGQDMLTAGPPQSLAPPRQAVPQRGEGRGAESGTISSEDGSAGVSAAEPGPTASPQPTTVATLPIHLTRAMREANAGVLDARLEGRVGERWLTSPRLLTGYVWPLVHGRITQPFGPNWAGTLFVEHLPFHDGLDMATFCGDRIVAAHDGVVLAAGRKVDPWMGWVGSLEPSVHRRDKHQLWYSLPIIVVVDDGNGYRSIYAHFNAIAVHRGQRVWAGQFLGWEGATGFATGCHLHYGLFSPLETRTMELRPDVARRTKLPRYEIVRIDPLLVLPNRSRPTDSGAEPSPTPTPPSTPVPSPTPAPHP
jgi:murein DD-endopeptidase MepM/ murein hydrolase activator NlpD